MPHTILGTFTGEWFEVATPEQAALLSDASALRHLEPFMGRALGAAQAAREAGVSTEGMLYRVRQFQRVGLLERVGETRRAGRPIKLYRAPAALRLPFHLTPFEDLKAQLSRSARAYEELRVQASARALRQLDSEARLIYRDEASGSVHSETELPDPSARQRRVGGDYVGTFWLTDEQAREVHAISEHLRETLAEHAQPRPGTRPYLLAGVLLPLDEREDARWLGTPPGGGAGADAQAPEG